jgi:hypothetical protein
MIKAAKLNEFGILCLKISKACNNKRDSKKYFK